MTAIPAPLVLRVFVGSACVGSHTNRARADVVRRLRPRLPRRGRRPRHRLSSPGVIGTPTYLLADTTNFLDIPEFSDLIARLDSSIDETRSVEDDR